MQKHLCTIYKGPRGLWPLEVEGRNLLYISLTSSQFWTSRFIPELDFSLTAILGAIILGSSGPLLGSVIFLFFCLGIFIYLLLGLVVARLAFIFVESDLHLVRYFLCSFMVSVSLLLLLIQIVRRFDDVTNVEQMQAENLNEATLASRYPTPE